MKNFKVVFASLMLMVAFIGFSSFKGSQKAVSTESYYFDGSEWVQGEPPTACTTGSFKCAFSFDNAGDARYDEYSEAVTEAEAAYQRNDPAGEIVLPDGANPPIHTGIFIEYKNSQ